jgi:hypothetical protein
MRTTTGWGMWSNSSIAKGACKCRYISSADVPRNGVCPVNIFQSVAPSE